MELSVRELQIKLTEVEQPFDMKSARSPNPLNSPNFSSSMTPFKDSNVEASLKRGEREKQLELLLQKTKKDKDKAIKLIVQIIGKDRIAGFLARYAGAPDILDRLLDHFGTQGSPGGILGGGDFSLTGAGMSSRMSVSSQSTFGRYC